MSGQLTPLSIAPGVLNKETLPLGIVALKVSNTSPYDLSFSGFGVSGDDVIPSGVEQMLYGSVYNSGVFQATLVNNRNITPANAGVILIVAYYADSEVPQGSWPVTIPTSTVNVSGNAGVTTAQFLQNDTSTAGTVFIESTVGSSQTTKVTVDGVWNLSVLISSVLHQILKTQTSGNQLLLGQAGDIVEALSNFIANGNFSVVGTSSLDNGNITTNGSGLMLFSGSVGGFSISVVNGKTSLDNGGITTDGNATLSLTGNINLNGGKEYVLNFPTALNGEAVGSQYIKGNGGAAGGSDFLIHNGNSGFIVLDGNAKHVSLRDGTNTAYMDFFDNGTVCVIQSDRTNGPIGFRNSNLQLGEFRGTGNMVIRGTTYFTTGTAGLGSGATFDSFDFSEVYAVDEEYEPGTVVCPKDTTTPIAYVGSHDLAEPVLTRCSHDGCNLASVIVENPAFCAGAINLPDAEEYNEDLPLKQPVAHSGRVFVKTFYEIRGGEYVCSATAGSVRPCRPGSGKMALGVALAPSYDGMVPILIRPTYLS